MMTKCKMKKLALAAAVALGGVGLIQSAQAVQVAQDGLGQVLIFPYYTVRGGWQTLLHVTNTSSSDIAAVKVRFHESYNSRDVFDFNVILSPNDVWTGYVSDSANGPVMNTVDTSCTAPVIPAGGAAFPAPLVNNVPSPPSFTGTAADGGPTTVDRMREGYAEMILMGTANVARLQGIAPGAPNYASAQLLLGAVHNPATGVLPANGCSNLAFAFQTNAAVFNSANGLKGQFGYPDLNGVALVPPDTTQNPLKGSFSLVNSGLGWSAGGLPVTLANFWAVLLGPGIANNLLSMQLPPASIPLAAPINWQISWHEPTLNSANTAGIILNPNTGAPLAGPASTAEAVGFTIQHTNIINEWSRRTDPQGWTTDTDWVVTYPTKLFYVDYDPNNQYSGRATPRTTFAPGLPPLAAWPAPPAPFASYFVNTAGAAGAPPGPATAIRAGLSCDAITFNLYDRNEKLAVGSGFSPGGNPQLCYEANVLTFDGSNILKSNAATVSSINGLPGEAGWLNIAFSAPAAGGATALMAPGRPAIGFQITVRNTSNSSLNEAMIFNHSYSRTYP
ncbi:MAG: hypothetical protein P9F75_14860 [Candidatus Contendobacter sp.]|nr:hypothetical protein [Candidatus Contendobacter sp.]